MYVNEREAALRRRFGDKSLQADTRGEEMAATSVAVTSAEHDVRVQLRFVVLQRDVAHERQYLHLLAHGNAFVAFLPVEVSERRFAQGADRCER